MQIAAIFNLNYSGGYMELAFTFDICNASILAMLGSKSGMVYFHVLQRSSVLSTLNYSKAHRCI